MSTRSIVAVKTESGIVGRYVHSDGYPEAKVPTLLALIERDGAAKVAETILKQDQGGWSYLHAGLADQGYNSLGADRAEIIEGYGLAYRDAPKDAPIRWEEAVGDPSFEYGYVIDPETGELEAYELYGSQAKRLKLEKFAQTGV